MTLNKLLDKFNEISQKIGYYSYDLDEFSKNKIENLQKQLYKVRLEILELVYGDK